MSVVVIAVCRSILAKAAPFVAGAMAPGLAAVAAVAAVSEPPEVGPASQDAKVSPGDLLRWNQERLDAAFDAESSPRKKGRADVRIGPVLVMSEADSETTASAVNRIRGLHAWFDDRLAKVEFASRSALPDEASGAIVRIGADAAGGFDAHGSTTLGGPGIEHLDFAPGDVDRDAMRIHEVVLRSWIRSHHPELWEQMPSWLNVGLLGLVRRAEVRGSKVRFGDEIEGGPTIEISVSRGPRTGVVIDESKWLPIRDLVRLVDADLTNSPRASDEALALVRYLLDGEGARKPQTKSLFADALSVASQEIGERRLGDTTDPAAVADAEVEKRVLDRIYERAFAAWTDADWKALDDAIEKSMRPRKR